MTAAVLIRKLLIFCFLSFLFSATNALAVEDNLIYPRANVILNNATGSLQAFDPDTHQPIPQGPATDGAGKSFSVPAVIWIAFSALVGLPMSVAGVRGWRFTTGVGIGLTSAVCAWAAFVNTIGASSLPDLLLVAIIMGFFFLGFVLGLFELGRVAGIALLGIEGGIAFGIRIMLLKKGLLIPLFVGNWLVSAFFGLVGGIVMVWERSQRGGICFGSASVGTFLSFLAVDLVVNRQSGMSRGLRFLFDRNTSHTVDITSNGYNPSLSTKILLAVSLALTPVLAYSQHRIFKHSFSRKPRPDSNALFGGGVNDPHVTSMTSHNTASQSTDRLLIKPRRGSLLSGFLDATRLKSRFSM